MDALSQIGAIVVGSVLLSTILVCLEIATNIVCGMRGAVRVAKVAGRPWKWKYIVSAGFRHWYGPRFNGHVGTYYTFGAMRVSPDIRDPIRREPFYGA